MITQTIESRRAICAVLNDLIGACEDDALVQLASASVVADSDLLLSRVEQRRRFVKQLSRMVVENQGRPRANGSTTQRMRIVLRKTRDLFIGSNSGDAYADCANAERKAERRYAIALAGELPSDVRELVERHHVEIARDGEMFRRKRFFS